ncbi:hypothetical protein BDV40DRAFT_294852 [Aspergillus tamarii]|uniref:EF-hand domain-containing protein n=1 Tax=Aspergillus tamarii TaxID=41984 RepID=A0A5N6VBB6_ASPTM|nr:hypothetical protein BDV40DRAFT_294852 [Aspergillus tamarii]
MPDPVTEAIKNLGRREIIQQHYREAQAKAAKEKEAAWRLRAACLEEVTNDPPKDVYYSADWIYSVLRVFYNANKDIDGQLSVDELANAWPTASEEYKKRIRESFAYIDITGDQKISLAGVRETGTTQVQRKSSSVGGSTFAKLSLKS